MPTREKTKKEKKCGAGLLKSYVEHRLRGHLVLCQVESSQKHEIIWCNDPRIHNSRLHRINLICSLPNVLWWYNPGGMTQWTKSFHLFQPSPNANQGGEPTSLRLSRRP